MEPIVIYCLIGLAIMIVGGLSETHGTIGDLANIIRRVGKWLGIALLIIVVLGFLGILG